MPKLVFRVSVEGKGNFPDLPFEGGRVNPRAWYDEQGITDGYYVDAIEVTEFDDGSLVAYLTYYETLTDEEYAELKRDRKFVSKLRVYPQEKPMTHSYIRHYPVTSIKLLLDQQAREEATV